MLKSAFVFLVLAIAASAQSSSLPAQGQARTFGQVNGRFWVILSDGQRLTFLGGWLDALTAVSTESLKKYFPSGATPDEIVRAVSAFYADPLNARIPIMGAFEITTLRANGSTQAEVEAMISIYRKVSSGGPQ